MAQAAPAASAARAEIAADGDVGFDSIFAGLGEPQPASTNSSRRDQPSKRPARLTRAERKAAKAEAAALKSAETDAITAEAPKAAASPAPGPRRSASASGPVVVPTAVPVAPAAVATTPDVAAAIAASRDASASFFDVVPAAPADDDHSDAYLQGTPWQPSTSVARESDRTSRRSAAAADLAAHGARARRGNAAGSGPARSTPGSSSTAAPGHPPAKARAKRRGRVTRVASGFAAMGFAALLAVATSVPSLSLLSPADVQAMALESATLDSEPGQRVEITGGTLAQTVDREGYETQTIDEYARAAGIRAEATFTNNPAGTIQWPFAVGVHIGDRFGYRDCAGCSSDHGGQDFNPGYGAEIQAIADGVVVNSTDEGGSLGVVMMIDHVIDGETVTSVYAHMIDGSRRFEVGDTVTVGDPIGQTGNTGMSTGPHLHFEIRLGGMSGTKVDPLVWLYDNTN